MVSAMSLYDRLKRRKRVILITIFADFIIIASIIGPLSNRYSSPVLTALSILGIAVFVGAGLLANFGPRCPRCGVIITSNTFAGGVWAVPAYCSKCGLNLAPVDKSGQPI
jgi:hypothetical protein